MCRDRRGCAQSETDQATPLESYRRPDWNTRRPYVVSTMRETALVRLRRATRKRARSHPSVDCAAVPSSDLLAIAWAEHLIAKHRCIGCPLAESPRSHDRGRRVRGDAQSHRATRPTDQFASGAPSSIAAALMPSSVHREQTRARKVERNAMNVAVQKL